MNLINNTLINSLLLQASTTKSLDVISLLAKGGVVMIFLAILSVLAIFFIIERMMFLGKNARVDQKVSAEYLRLMTSGKKEEAAELCSKEKTGWGRIFLFGTISSLKTAEEVDHVLEDAANVEIARMEKNLGYLSIIAGVAPLLGFIGTIIGVIKIFYDISVQGEITIPVISEGLYTKMVSSATGLVVGIIAFTAHHFFQNQVDTFVNKVQEQALNLKIALSR